MASTVWAQSHIVFLGVLVFSASEIVLLVLSVTAYVVSARRCVYAFVPRVFIIASCINTRLACPCNHVGAVEWTARQEMAASSDETTRRKGSDVDRCVRLNYGGHLSCCSRQVCVSIVQL